MRGSEDEVISLTDCLAYGPISSGSFEDRSDWLDAHTPIWRGWDWIIPSAKHFLTTIRNWADNRLVWIALRSACEQSGLQWCFEQTKIPAGPMIIADQPIRFKKDTAVPLSLGELADEYVADLLDHAPRRAWPAERSSWNEWRRLRSENALLRIVADGCLRSVSPDYFDHLLLKHCSGDWQKWSRVVGNAMIDAMEQGYHAGDALLLWRVRALAGSGQIECRGELPGREHGPDKRPTAELRVKS